MDRRNLNLIERIRAILKAELDKRGWNQTDLGFVLGRNQKA